MADLIKLKQRVEDKLMPLDYITGVGVSGSKLAVYVSRALKKEEAAHVEKTISDDAPNTPFTVHVTGDFTKS